MKIRLIPEWTSELPSFFMYSELILKVLMILLIAAFLLHYTIMSVMKWGQSISININDMLVYPFIILFAVTFSLTFYFQRKDMQRKAAFMAWVADLLFVIMLFAVVIAPLTALNFSHLNKQILPKIW